jgi:hypothetical protein
VQPEEAAAVSPPAEPLPQPKPEEALTRLAELLARSDASLAEALPEIDALLARMPTEGAARPDTEAWASPATPFEPPPPPRARGGQDRPDMAVVTALIAASGTLATGVAVMANLVLARGSRRRQAREFELKLRKLSHLVRELEAMKLRDGGRTPPYGESRPGSGPYGGVGRRSGQNGTAPARTPGEGGAVEGDGGPPELFPPAFRATRREAGMSEDPFRRSGPAAAHGAAAAMP